jgi:hypothetical protein
VHIIRAGTCAHVNFKLVPKCDLRISSQLSQSQCLACAASQGIECSGADNESQHFGEWNLKGSLFFGVFLLAQCVGRNQLSTSIINRVNRQ